MAKMAYTEDVTVEEITFDEKIKARMIKGEKITDAGFQKQGTGKDAIFFTVRSVNGTGTRVEEGQVIVTYSDGRQKLISADEAKKQFGKIKEDPADKAAIKEAAKKSKEDSDANQKSLADKAEEQGNSIGAQSDVEERNRHEAEAITAKKKNLPTQE